jgi:DNA-binding GntR family transcriptional regulator
MNKSLRYQAYNALKAMIIDLELKPGERLIESDLAMKLDIGRTPIREALLKLEQDKLVDCIGKSGYYIRRLNKKEVDEYYALRTALEDFAAPLVIERITPSAIEALHENIRRCEEVGEKGEIRTVAHLHSQFDRILYQATDSEAFMGIIFLLLDRLHWLRAVALSDLGGRQQSLDGHKRIVKSIEEKDLDGLRDAIRVHLKNSREYFGKMEALLF